MPPSGCCRPSPAKWRLLYSSTPNAAIDAQTSETERHVFERHHLLDVEEHVFDLPVVRMPDEVTLRKTVTDTFSLVIQQNRGEYLNYVGFIDDRVAAKQVLFEITQAIPIVVHVGITGI